MVFTFKSCKSVYNLSHIHHSGNLADCSEGSFRHGWIWFFNRHLNILNLFIYYFKTNLFMPKICTLSPLYVLSPACLYQSVPTLSLMPDSADPQGPITSNTPSHGKGSCHVLQNKGQESNILYSFNTKDLHTTSLPSVLREKSFSMSTFEMLWG